MFSGLKNLGTDVVFCVSQSLRHGCAVPPPFTQGRLARFHRNCLFQRKIDIFLLVSAVPKCSPTVWLPPRGNCRGRRLMECACAAKFDLISKCRKLPPSRLRRATSLYTREAYRIPLLLPLSEVNRYIFVSFSSAEMFANSMATSARKLSRQATYGVRGRQSLI